MNVITLPLAQIPQTPLQTTSSTRFRPASTKPLGINPLLPTRPPSRKSNHPSQSPVAASGCRLAERPKSSSNSEIANSVSRPPKPEKAKRIGSATVRRRNPKIAEEGGTADAGDSDADDVQLEVVHFDVVLKPQRVDLDALNLGGALGGLGGLGGLGAGISAWGEVDEVPPLGATLAAENSYLVPDPCIKLNMDDALDSVSQYPASLRSQQTKPRKPQQASLTVVYKPENNDSEPEEEQNIPQPPPPCPPSAKSSATRPLSSKSRISNATKAYPTTITCTSKQNATESDQESQDAWSRFLDPHGPVLRIPVKTSNSSTSKTTTRLSTRQRQLSMLALEKSIRSSISAGPTPPTPQYHQHIPVTFSKALLSSSSPSIPSNDPGKFHNPLNVIVSKRYSNTKSEITALQPTSPSIHTLNSSASSSTLLPSDRIVSVLTHQPMEDPTWKYLKQRRAVPPTILTPQSSSSSLSSQTSISKGSNSQSTRSNQSIASLMEPRSSSLHFRRPSSSFPLISTSTQVISSVADMSQPRYESLTMRASYSEYLFGNSVKAAEGSNHGGSSANSGFTGRRSKTSLSHY